MTHRMILASADLKAIYKVVVAKKKLDATVAQVGERRFRKPEGASSNDAGSSRLEDRKRPEG